MLRTKVWLTTTLIIAGILGGLIYNWPRAHEEDQRGNPNVAEANAGVNLPERGKPLLSSLADLPQTHEELDSLHVELDTDQIDEGDRLLLVGNFGGANRAYIKASNKRGGESQATLLIRLAMASEQLRDFTRAGLLYQQAVRNSNDGSVIRLLSLNGLARAWQHQGKLAQSQELLSELFLRYASDEKIDSEIRMQLVWQLGNVIQLQYLAGPLAKQSSLDSIEFNWCGPSIDAMIELLTEFGNTGGQVTSEDSTRQETVFMILQRPADDVNLIAVDTLTPIILINDVLDQYAQEAGINFNLSRPARSAIRGRSTQLSVSGMPLALVLDQLLAPLGLVWSQNGTLVSVYEAAENVIDIQRFRTQVADRVLRTVELSFSRDVRRDSSLLHRGNLSLLSLDFAAAENRYVELLRLSPNNELAAKLNFNMAFVELAGGRQEQAVKRLFFAVDQSLDQPLQAKSYAWIGRLELEQGQAERAIYSTSRGFSLATNKQVREDLLMNLARAYLLENDPFSCNRVLFNHANAVMAPRQIKLAAVLSAYARYLGMEPTEGLRNEGERMVVALASINSGDAIGFVDKLLVGRAFYEVGFSSRSIEYLELAMKEAPNENWRRRVAFELATHQFRSGELEAAAKTFRTVADTTLDGTGLLARFKLASIALSQKEPARCLEVCKQIWHQELTEKQKVETLSMMGQAYQRLGRHQVAAVCFSGMLPQEFDVENIESQPEGLTNSVPTQSSQNFLN